MLISQQWQKRAQSGSNQSNNRLAKPLKRENAELYGPAICARARPRVSVESRKFVFYNRECVRFPVLAFNQYKFFQLFANFISFVLLTIKIKV